MRNPLVRTSAALVIGLGMCTAAVCFAAAAAESSPEAAQVMEAARRSLAAGNPKQAYVDLAAIQGRMAGDPEYDYLLGVAALDSGRNDDAIIAFERVLAINPKHAGAQMDLARAYYATGAYDLAEATFRNLQENNPPPLALQSINRYLSAIGERKKLTRPGISGYGEMGLGYDSNITGVPSDFSSAVLSAFNLAGVNPTGNSIKRKAAFLSAGGGLDYYRPIAPGWSFFAGGDVHGRAYRNEPDFNSKAVEVRTGTALNAGAQQWRLSANYARFDQNGEAPGDPRPTNNRNAAGASLDWRLSLDQRSQVGAGVQYTRQRFPDNVIEDFNQVLVSASWLRSFDTKGLPLVYLAAFYTNDDAVRKLADGVSDKSKHVGGARAYAQYGLRPDLQAFAGVGYTLRRDESAFARATQVDLGRDKLIDTSLGVNWKFQAGCTLRAQWLYSRNDSNIAIYDYSRNEVSSNIRCEFG